MLPNVQIGFGMSGKPKEKDRRDSGVSESVQLPSIGGAPSAAGDDLPHINHLCEMMRCLMLLTT